MFNSGLELYADLLWVITVRINSGLKPLLYPFEQLYYTQLSQLLPPDHLVNKME